MQNDVKPSSLGGDGGLLSSNASSLQPAMNPTSYGNTIRQTILEEGKESSGDEQEERRRGL